MINLAAGIEPITYVAGDDRNLPFEFVTQTGTGIDVSSWAFTFLITSCTGTAIATLTNGSGITVSGNTATVSLSATVTGNAALDDGNYILKATVAGKTRTYVKGKFRKQQ